MEQLETIAPLAVLFGIAWLLVILLRRSMRETSETGAWREAVPAPVVVVKRPRPIVVAPVKPAKVEPIEIKPVLPAKAARVTAAPAKTPVHGVLALLQDKDALVKAFLLREILGPPAALRGRKV